MPRESLHSVCRWTFNPGKGGFVPGDMRPEWGRGFGTPEMIELVAKKIRPRIPEHIVLGIEMHYDAEVDDANAAAVADALVSSKLYVAMITPGAHTHFGYGGIASLDPNERRAAEKLGAKTVDLAYGALKKAWHPEKAPAFVIWNGSFGYDIATIGIKQMYQNLKESVANLCRYEAAKGGQLHIGFEPKPNEGHPDMCSTIGTPSSWQASPRHSAGIVLKAWSRFIWAIDVCPSNTIVPPRLIWRRMVRARASLIVPAGTATGPRAQHPL